MPDPLWNEVLARAAALLIAQPSVPKSPGMMTESGPLLCSAAAIVLQAASERLPAHEIPRLAEAMVTNPKEFILDRADELGLDRLMVEQHMLTNDSCPDDGRKERMSALLRAH